MTPLVLDVIIDGRARDRRSSRARARMLTIRPLRPPQPREESIEPRRAVFFIIVPLWPSSSSGGSTQAALRLPGQPGDGDAHRAFFLFFLTSFIIIITSAIIIISAAAAAAAAALYRDKPLFSSFCVVVVGRLQQFIAYIYSLRCAVIMRAGKYANEAQCSGPTTSSGVKSQREPPWLAMLIKLSFFLSTSSFFFFFFFFERNFYLDDAFRIGQCVWASSHTPFCRRTSAQWFWKRPRRLLPSPPPFSHPPSSSSSSSRGLMIIRLIILMMMMIGPLGFSSEMIVWK